MDKELRYQRALQLYNTCKSEGCDQVPDPVNWVYNRNAMRLMHENFNKMNENVPEPLRNMMMGNSMGVYMDYMYNNY
jgi:hypothetical protein